MKNPPIKKSGIPYRPDIDGLRAIAVLSVVLYHITPALLPGGFIGVDIFFVISGYLISSIIFKGVDQNTFSFSTFYARRIRRIFPALILVFSTCLFVGYSVLLASEYKMLGKHVAAGAGFLANFSFLRETGYFDIAAELKPFLHLWSLGIEEQFYIIWPLLIVITARFRCNLLLVTVVITLFSFVTNIWRVDAHLAQTFYHPLTRFWELMLGAILAQASICSKKTLQRHQKRFSNLSSIVGFSLIVTALFFVNRQDIFPGWRATLPTIGAFLLIAAGPGAWINSKVLSLAPVIFLGLISYPLYLWHWPLLSFLRIIESGTPPLLLLLLAAILAFFLSWLTYLLVEKRLRRHPSRLVVPGLLAVMVLLATTGKIIEKKDGLPGRSHVAYLQDFDEQLIRKPAVDTGCEQYVKNLGEKRSFHYCRTRNLQAKKWLAIVGDSHAHVLFPGFSEEASKQGYGTILLANTSCPPLLGTATGKTDTQLSECSNEIDQILKLVNREHRIKKIVFATRGPVYISGKEFSQTKSVEKTVNFQSFPKHISGRSEQLFFDSLKDTIQNFHIHGKEVAYFLENPEIGRRPQDCKKRPFSFEKKHSTFQVNFNQYSSRMFNYRRGLIHLSTKNPYILVLDPESLFCNKQVCRGILQGKLLYADGDHLSIAGSDYVAKKLAPLFLK